MLDQAGSLALPRQALRLALQEAAAACCDTAETPKEVAT
jgi:hypothetical protein